MKEYVVKDVKSSQFNLDHIFDCGQCFRFKKNEDGSYTGIAKEKIVTFSYDDKNEELWIKGSDEKDFFNIWKNYLDLDTDYGAIKNALASKDTIIKKAMDYGYGIRILKQDLWEMIISFIISQNNNIPRIKGCIESLATNFGEQIISQDGSKGFNMPTAERLAMLTTYDLQPIKLGYRSKYLIDTAKVVSENGLPESDEQLRRLVGVGPKVASCIKLFGMGHMDSFPIDVWVKRVMNTLYGIEENDLKTMTNFAAETFGEYGGIAQQYLFYYMRTYIK